MSAPLMADLARTARSVPGVVRLQPPLLQGLTALARGEHTDPALRALVLTGAPGAHALEVRVVVSLEAGPLAVVTALEQALGALLGEGAVVRVVVVDVGR